MAMMAKSEKKAAHNKIALAQKQCDKTIGDTILKMSSMPLEHIFCIDYLARTGMDGLKYLASKDKKDKELKDMIRNAKPILDKLDGFCKEIEKALQQFHNTVHKYDTECNKCKKSSCSVKGVKKGGK